MLYKKLFSLCTIAGKIIDVESFRWKTASANFMRSIYGNGEPHMREDESDKINLIEWAI